MRHDLDFGDVLNVFVPGYKDTVDEAKQAVSKANESVDWIKEHWMAIAAGFFLMMVLASVIANKITE